MDNCQIATAWTFTRPEFSHENTSGTKVNVLCLCLCTLQQPANRPILLQQIYACETDPIYQNHPRNPKIR